MPIFKASVIRKTAIFLAAAMLSFSAVAANFNEN
ncbi:hypothetical protein FHS24_001913 [Psychrobacter luti]|uniref:Uncharacterized protein n=1 Tax=Psychrobacter luti TaxID=198481 RepID=A0A839TDW8_9GAMM|nr:hypothetical protein [Psychrobacter luti]